MMMEVKVSGMHCPSCLALIKMNIEELKGISIVTGDYQKGIVQVTFDEKMAPQQDIVQKIEQENYKVTRVETKGVIGWKHKREP